QIRDTEVAPALQQQAGSRPAGSYAPTAQGRIWVEMVQYFFGKTLITYMEKCWSARSTAPACMTLQG
ncbi:MAG: hypothetical protein NTV22_00845, partial [bacterium]|nr:hypothetical protein [bacterium]